MNANGRVNILDQSSSNVFSLYDKIPINENTSEYRQAMKGTFENTELSNLYFSKENIETLQHPLECVVSDSRKWLKGAISTDHQQTILPTSPMERRL